MTDKKDLGISVYQTIEWCSRYAWINNDWQLCNWEVYIGDRLVAYSYLNDNAYIVKYAATWHFPKEYKVEIKYWHENKKYRMRKVYN